MSIDVGKYQASVPSSAPKQESKLSTLLSQDIRLPGQGWNDKRRERFYGELQTLLTAGVDLRSALDLLAREQKKKFEAEFYQELVDEVIEGKSLSEALEASGNFGPYEYFSIRIGEESGRLLEILHELQTFYSKKIKLKRQMVSVMTYPLFVFSVSIGVIWFMLTYIVPMFGDVFKRFDSELPELTQFVITLSNYLGTYLPWMLLIAAGVGALLFTQRKTVWFRRSTSSVLRYIPFFGPLINKVFVARFCQSMHLLTSAKTPLVDSLDMVGLMIRFYPLEVACKAMQKQLSQGTALNESMRPFKVFDSRMIALTKVAEEVNQLDVMFGKLAKQYSDDVEHKTGLMGSILEPLMIVFIALFVGLILVAMYLPLFQLSTTIG